MSNKNWLDFKEIKAKVSMTDLLKRYGLLDKMKSSGGGEQLSGFCPLPQHTGKGKKSRSFSVHPGKNAWKCFSCDQGGNQLDFVMAMEGLDSVREAAALISEWFNGVGATAPPEDKSESEIAPAAHQEDQLAEERKETEVQGNPPLTFQLKDLDSEHAYLKERGLKPETVEHFGVGLCSRGLMKSRVVIPIHNAQGELVAYAGRAVTEQDEPACADRQEAKYKFPPKFRKSLEVFNLHRGLAEGDGQSLIVTEGFFDVFWLWQGGYKNGVALMGSDMSSEQESKIMEALGSRGRVTLLFDGDAAGQRCMDDVQARLVPRLFVKVIALQDGQQPDGLDSAELERLLGPPTV